MRLSHLKSYFKLECYPQTTAPLLPALILFLLVSFNPKSAHANTKNNSAHAVKQSSHESCSDLLQASHELDYESIFSEMAKDASNAIGVRGFLGSYPDETAESARVAEKYGIMSWTIFIFVMPTFEAAQAHAQQNFEVRADGTVGRKDPIQQGLYIIDSQYEPNNLHEGTPTASAQNYIQKMLESGAFYFPDPHDTKIFTKYDGSYLKKYLNPQLGSPIWLTENQLMGPMIVVRGWTQPSIRGVVNIKDFMSSSTYKNVLAKFARPSARNGFRITFNTAHEASMDALKMQKRKSQDLAQNRYYDVNAPDHASPTYHAMLNRLKEGSALTVEVWSPDNKLVAGMIATRTGDLISPDSVFYEQSVLFTKTQVEAGQTIITEKKIAGIDLVKVAFVALIERLNVAGIAILDTQIVSHLTEKLLADYISRDDFLVLLKELTTKDSSSINFSDWSPTLTTP